MNGNPHNAIFEIIMHELAIGICMVKLPIHRRS